MAFLLSEPAHANTSFLSAREKEFTFSFSSLFRGDFPSRSDTYVVISSLLIYQLSLVFSFLFPFLEGQERRERELLLFSRKRRNYYYCHYYCCCSCVDGDFSVCALFL